MCQLGDGISRRALHVLVDNSRADVKRATENEREAQDVLTWFG